MRGPMTCVVPSAVCPPRMCRPFWAGSPTLHSAMSEPRRGTLSQYALLVLNVAALEVPTPPHQSTLSTQLPQAAHALLSPAPDPSGTAFSHRHEQSALTVTIDNVGSSTSAHLATDSATSARMRHACATSASASTTGTTPVNIPFTVNTTVLRSPTDRGTPPTVYTTMDPTLRHQAFSVTAAEVVPPPALAAHAALLATAVEVVPPPALTAHAALLATVAQAVPPPAPTAHAALSVIAPGAPAVAIEAMPSPPPGRSLTWILTQLWIVELVICTGGHVATQLWREQQLHRPRSHSTPLTDVCHICGRVGAARRANCTCDQSRRARRTNRGPRAEHAVAPPRKTTWDLRAERHAAAVAIAAAEIGRATV